MPFCRFHISGKNKSMEGKDLLLLFIQKALVGIYLHCEKVVDYTAYITTTFK